MDREIFDRFPETKGKRLIRDERKKPVMMLELAGMVPVLRFPKLSEFREVEHFFTTRAGGVSKDQFSSLNFSISLGDSAENVHENFNRCAQGLGICVDDITGTIQTHTTNILRITQKEKGMAVTRKATYHDIDGLVTNERGIALAAYAADCVPLFFYDPVHRAVGIAHSGWRGTAADMAGCMVKRMKDEFDTDPAELVAAIAPSICRKCYEVDEPVAKAFREKLGDTIEERLLIRDAVIYPMASENGLHDILENSINEGRYQLDLWLSNLILMMRSGIKLENIDITDLCTAHNPKLLFSHRASAGKRGNLGAFICLK